ncbi:MAG: tetratricopeptide repeat protein [Phycisphaerales bacterium]|nr:tetratricopeptide repeat protein [Phycisphaerales bacterium]
MPTELTRVAIISLLLGACAAPQEAPPQPTGPSEAELAERAIRMHDASSSLERGEYQEAVVLFQEVLDVEPESVPAWIGLGDAHAGLEEWIAAEPSYATAAKLDPGSYDAQLGHGTSLQILERFSDAVGAFHRALVIRPRSEDAALGLTTTYLQMGEPDLALPFAKRAVSLDDANGLGWVAFGAALEGSGDQEAALRAYLSAAERMPPSPQLLRNILYSYVRLKHYRQVIGTARSLESLEGPSPDALERSGWAWFKLGEYDRSAAAYRRSTNVDPGWWRAWNGLGVTALNRWLLSGRTDINAREEASNALRRSLQLNKKQTKVVDLVSRYGL